MNLAVAFQSWDSFAQTPAQEAQNVAKHARRAEEFLRQNRPDLAIPEYRILVALNPAESTSRANLGVLLFFWGSYAEAAPEFRAALQLQPDQPKLQALLGMAEKRTGNLSGARADLESAFPKLSDPKVQIQSGMELVELHQQSGDLTKAAAVIAALAAVQPDNVDVISASYQIYSQQMEASILHLAMVAPGSAQFRRVLGSEMARQGNNSEAIQQFQAAADIMPDLPGLEFDLGEMLRAETGTQGKSEAEAKYKLALQQNEFDERSLCRLAEFAADRGASQEALDLYTRAVQVRSDDAEAEVGLAKILVDLDQRDKATTLLEKAVAADPTSTVARYRLSVLYRQSGKKVEAEQQLKIYKGLKEARQQLEQAFKQIHLSAEHRAGNMEEDGAASVK
jgi:tetratricopeptide (TPR) repeat protein